MATMTLEKSITSPPPIAGWRAWLLAVVVVSAVLGVWRLAPIPQDPAYHQFADTRVVAGIPYGWNVLSNSLLFVVGLMGLSVVLYLRRAGSQSVLQPYAVLFAGMVLTSAGSSYYHAEPSNARLLWDRLPMTIAFMGFFCSVIAEVMSRRLATRLLPGLLGIGVAAVLYWYSGEMRGAGDLRLYVLVQFLPMLLIPLLLLMFPRPKNYLPWVLAMLGLYALSKLFELWDAEIFSWGEIISGHTLKHILAAAAPACLLPILRRRLQKLSAS